MPTLTGSHPARRKAGDKERYELGFDGIVQLAQNHVARPCAINLVRHLIFTPAQFRFLAKIPSFMWVSLATALQLSITAMNW